MFTDEEGDMQEKLVEFSVNHIESKSKIYRTTVDIAKHVLESGHKSSLMLLLKATSYGDIFGDLLGETDEDLCKLKVTLSIEWIAVDAKENTGRARANTVPVHHSPTKAFHSVPINTSPHPEDELDLETRTDFSQTEAHSETETTVGSPGVTRSQSKHRRGNSEGALAPVVRMPQIPPKMPTPSAKAMSPATPAPPPAVAARRAGRHKRSSSLIEPGASVVGVELQAGHRVAASFDGEACVVKAPVEGFLGHGRQGSQGSQGSDGGGSGSAVGHHRRGSSADLETVNDNLSKAITERDALAEEVKALKKEIRSKDTQLKAQLRLAQMATRSSAVAEKDEEIATLKQQIQTLQAFIGQEADHPTRPRAESSSVFATPQDQVIQELEEKIAHLETDLLATKLRNAALEEESVKLQNLVNKASRAQNDEDGQRPLSTNNFDVANFFGVGRARRGSV